MVYFRLFLETLAAIDATWIVKHDPSTREFHVYNLRATVPTDYAWCMSFGSYIAYSIANRDRIIPLRHGFVLGADRKYYIKAWSKELQTVLKHGPLPVQHALKEWKEML